MGLELIIPNPGLFLWTVILFLIFFFILRKMAWKPILQALHKREDEIEQSLQQAAEARREMEKLQADNEAMFKEARQEREKILKEANQMKDQIVKEARDEAQKAAAKEREKARQEIEAQKASALSEIKDTAASIAVEVAEKILREEFSDQKQQEAFAAKLIADLNQN